MVGEPGSVALGDKPGERADGGEAGEPAGVAEAAQDLAGEDVADPRRPDKTMPSGSVRSRGAILWAADRRTGPRERR